MDSTRRTFLKTTVVGGAAVASTGLGAPGCGNPVDVPTEVKVAVAADGSIRVPLASVPPLASVGGAVTLKLVLGAGATFSLPSGGILLVRRGTPTDLPEWIAVESACPHLACPLGYSAADKRIECPCHASRFLAAPDPALPSSRVGTVTHLPANVDLRTYDVKFDATTDTVTVNLGQCSMDNPVLPAPVNGVVTFALGDVPALQAVNGWSLAQVSGQCQHLLLVRRDMSTVLAFSSVCTHLQCDVLYDAPPKAGDLHCYCHNSHYDLTGKVTRPADGGSANQAPLPKYEATLNGSTVTVKLA